MRDRSSTPIFDAVPSHIRMRDGEEQRALEALLALLTEELEIVERDIDQLYDNWFVETCEPWVLPYISELIGATPMREIGPGQAGQLRAYVANVLQYRQAKGTAAALEQVARDVTGWPVVVVEFFRQLTTAEHVNHLRGSRPVTASVRRADEPQLAHRPFSRASHLPAAGIADGFSGRFNIPNLGLFVWRHAAQPLFPLITEDDGYLGGPEPALLDPDGSVRRFDPMGRDLPLVNLPQPDLTIADRVSPLNVPEQLRREPLADELDGLRDGTISAAKWFGSQPVLRVRLDGAEVPPAKLFCCNLAAAEDGSIRKPAAAGSVLFDPVLGRLSLHASDRNKSAETGFAAPQALDVGGGAYDRRESVEGWWDDFFTPGEDPPWIIGVTRRAELQTDNVDQGGPVVGSLREAVERWNGLADRSRGVIVMLDNATYDEAINGAAGTIDLTGGAQLAIFAADWPRSPQADGTAPRFLDAISPALCRPFIKSNMRVRANAGPEDEPARLILSGLLIAHLQANNGEAPGRLELLDCTLGWQWDDTQRFGEALKLNEQDGLSLTVERSNLGRVAMLNTAATISISDSVLAVGAQPARGNLNALSAPQSDLSIERSTIMGKTETRTIEAEDSIFCGTVNVAFRQTGCVRFSFVTSDSVVPRRYRCVSETSASDGGTLRPAFVTDDFGRPGFSMLTPGCSIQIREGADGNLEMGVGNNLRAPARLANLREAIGEYAPVGLNTGVLFVEE